MKKIKYLCLVFCFYSLNLFAQKDAINSIPCTDTLNISGYYILVYTKKGMKDVIRNNKRLQQGKSFVTKFYLSDIETFFIPVDSINGNEQMAGVLDNLMTANKTDFYISYSEFSDLHYKWNIDANCLDYLRHVNFPRFPNFQSNDYYITTSKKNEYCFQIFTLSAQWIRIKFPTWESINYTFGRKSRFFIKEAAFYNIYILNEVFDYNLTPLLEYDTIKLLW